MPEAQQTSRNFGFLIVHDRLLDHLGALAPSFWLFQANPTKFDYLAGLAQRQPGDEDEWLVTRYREQMQVGDRVIIWVAGAEGGIHAEGTLTTIPEHQDGTNAYPTHTEAKASYRVRFR